MANKVPSTVFLAGSTVELISALACLNGLGITDAIIFVERNISFKTTAMDPLLVAARTRFPTTQFIELAIERPARSEAAKKGLSAFVHQWNLIRSVSRQLDMACQMNFQMALKPFAAQIKEIYFTTVLHDYILVFLAATHGAKRVFYPHGFDHPRRQQSREYAYHVRRRALRTIIETFRQQKSHFKWGGLFLGVLGRLLGMTTVNLPFSGVDRVLTFRSDIDFVPNEVVKVPSLETIFQWLLQLPPWHDLLQARKNKTGSLLLLLLECNCHPIWKKNRHFGLAHLRLSQMAAEVTGARRFVIKSHVRSDGSAAEWLAHFLREQEKEWEIEILPQTLSGLPVEALALTGEFNAACSLGSCSLPPGLGFGIPHYTSPTVSGLFDQGWPDGTFWLKYGECAEMLIEEGICRNMDKLTELTDGNTSGSGAHARERA